MDEQESWATGLMLQFLANNWYGTVEAIVANLVEEQDENPLASMAERLESWITEDLLSIHCEKCNHYFEIGGEARWIVTDFFLRQVDWQAVAKEYEEDLVREGGVKISDHEWTWEEVDGGEYDGDD